LRITVGRTSICVFGSEAFDCFANATKDTCRLLVRLAGHNAVGVPNRLQPIWQGEFEHSEAAEYHAVQQVYGLSRILNGHRRRRDEIAGTVKAIVHCVCKAVKAALRFWPGW
jgi:hypothetical protein